MTEVAAITSCSVAHPRLEANPGLVGLADERALRLFAFVDGHTCITPPSVQSRFLEL